MAHIDEADENQNDTDEFYDDAYSVDNKIEDVLLGADKNEFVNRIISNQDRGNNVLMGNEAGSETLSAATFSDSQNSDEKSAVFDVIYDKNSSVINNDFINEFENSLSTSTLKYVTYDEFENQEKDFELDNLSSANKHPVLSTTKSAIYNNVTSVNVTGEIISPDLIFDADANDLNKIDASDEVSSFSQTASNISVLSDSTATMPALLTNSTNLITYPGMSPLFG